MKQVFQDVAKGKSEVISVPRPACKDGHVVIQSSCSLISAGTERMVADFSRAGYLEKARQKPDKVKMVVNKVRSDGLMATVEAVRAKLEEPIPMGYSNVGTVIEIGSGVSEFSVGDRVVSNGYHAGVVCVSKNLCARIPDDVTDDDAVFTVVGSIALQGTRLAQPTLGESFVVIGLGLIGLLTVQILRAQGCRVLGVDFDNAKLEMARSFGADTVNPKEGDDAVDKSYSFSKGRGVDGVIITASSKSNEPIHQAATMCRMRGRIVLVGVIGLDLDRADFYAKELTFQVSCSYGPGRYDPAYEDLGQDYPLGFVRWTEQRNFEAVLEMLGSGAIQTSDLRSAKFPVEEASDAYDLLIQDRSVLGVIITYEQDAQDDASSARTVMLKEVPAVSVPGKAIVAAIGAGNYAGRVLLPALQMAGAEMGIIASSQGISGSHIGRKLGFTANTTDADAAIDYQDVDTVVIATQHDSHAEYAVKALESGKHVFVEKPLALTLDELESVDAAYRAAEQRGVSPILMVGFNRRFAPQMTKLKKAICTSDAPISLIYTCNAGASEKGSWVQDPARGGGRIVGEACHFIDIARFLAASPIIDMQASAMIQPGSSNDSRDTATLTIRFENGSLASVHYFANGHRSVPKERIEVYQAGSIMLIDNFQRFRQFGRGLGGPGSRKRGKGQKECCALFVDAVRNGKSSPIPYPELIEVSRRSIEAATLIREQSLNE